MFSLIRRRWQHFRTSMEMRFEESADPEVQLTQALASAQQQHARLREQAIAVIAAQKQSEIRLNAKLADLERLNRLARQALLEADRCSDAVKAAEYITAAQTIASQLITVEAEIEDLKSQVIAATRAADDAKAAVAANQAQLRARMDDQVRLRGQLSQAKMAEQMNAARAAISETVGEDVPSVAAIEAKIQARYARATAAAELDGGNADVRMFEIEQASTASLAASRLDQFRAELGLNHAAVELESPAS